MVQAKVVKGAGGASDQSLDCSQILAMFDPKIEFGSHSEMQGSLNKREAYNAKSGKGYQAEHAPPAGILHTKGRSGSLVAGARGSSYSTGGALTWMAHDGQIARREHKILTDAMRRFSQLNDAPPASRATLKEWLNAYKDGVKDALTNADPKRAIKKPPDVDEASLIAQAAECIAEAAEADFAAKGVPLSTQCRNPWKATKEQIREAQAAIQAAKSGSPV
jgi:hypothetical protein